MKGNQMKCMTRNVLYGIGIFAVFVYFLAPSARHFLPVLASLACPLSMVGMMFGASRLTKKNGLGTPISADGAGVLPPSMVTLDADRGADRGADRDADRDVDRDVDIALLKARIAELENASPKPIG